MEKKLRKHSNTLKTAGLGVILFGAWTTVKVLMFLIYSPILDEAAPQAARDIGVTTDFIFTALYIIVGVFLAAELALRSYVGFSAMAEGRGRKKSSFYLLACIALLISSISFFVNNVSGYFGEHTSLIDGIISLAIELTSLYTLTELVFSGVMVKRLKKQI